jgi:hypothetical protein
VGEERQEQEGEVRMKDKEERKQREPAGQKKHGN